MKKVLKFNISFATPMQHSKEAKKMKGKKECISIVKIW